MGAKTINFSRMKIFTGMSHRESIEQDVRETFADVIYRSCPGIAALELARKIYHSEGDTEYTEQEVNIIRQASRMCTAQFIEAIEQLINSEK